MITRKKISLRVEDLQNNEQNTISKVGKFGSPKSPPESILPVMPQVRNSDQLIQISGDDGQHRWKQKLMIGQQSHREQLKQIRAQVSLNSTPRKLIPRKKTIFAPQSGDSTPRTSLAHNRKLTRLSVELIPDPKRLPTAENTFSPRLKIPSTHRYLQECSQDFASQSISTVKVHQRSILLQNPIAKSFHRSKQPSKTFTLKDLHHDILLESSRQRYYQTSKELEMMEQEQKFEIEKVEMQKQLAIERNFQLKNKLKYLSIKDVDAAKLLEEINITSEMYEQTTTNLKQEDILPGICSDILFQYQEQISREVPQTFSSYMLELSSLTKLYRQLIRAILCCNPLTFDQDHQLKTSMATLWNMVILNFDSLMGQQEDRIRQNQDKLYKEFENQIEKATKSLNKKVETMGQQLKEFEEENKQLKQQNEKRQKEITILSNQVKEQDELLDQLNDKKGLGQIKDILDDFGASMDILSLEKQVQLNVMHKACGILKQQLPNAPDESPKSKKKKGRKVEISHSFTDCVPVFSEDQVKKSFAEELKAAKRQTNFLFYQSALPFDISNIAPNQFSQIQDYFQISILKTLVKEKNTRYCQTDEVTEKKLYQVPSSRKIMPVNMSRQQSKTRIHELDDLAISEVNSENSLESDDMSSNANSPIKRQQSIKNTATASPQAKKPINFGLTQDSRESSKKKLIPSPSMSMAQIFSGMGDKNAKVKTDSSVNLLKLQSIKQESQKNLLFRVKNEKLQKNLKAKMKNPVMKAIKQCLKLEKRAGFDLKSELSKQEILEFMDRVMTLKVYQDLSFAKGADVLLRKPQGFTSFVYEQMLVKMGVQTATNKQFVMMCNGLNHYEMVNPYAKTLNRMLGLNTPPLRLDEIQVILKSHEFFNICQKKWLQRCKNSPSLTQPEGEDLQNIKDGGTCSIFEIIDGLKDSFKSDKQMSDRLLSTLRPDCLQKESLKVATKTQIAGKLAVAIQNQMSNTQKADKKKKDKDMLYLEFSILKIAWKINTMGVKADYVYKLLDEEKTNCLGPLEILNGLKNYLGVYLTRDETNKLSVHLDEDQSGDIDCSEFCEKITTENLFVRCEKFTISKNLFIEKMLTAWSFYKDRERRSLVDKNPIFTHKNNGGMDLIKLGSLLKQLEPSLQDSQILQLFKTATEMEAGDGSNDKISSEVLQDLVIENKIGGFGSEFFSNVLDK